MFFGLIWISNLYLNEGSYAHTLGSDPMKAKNKQTAKAVCYLSRYSYFTVYYVGVRKDGAVLGINDPDGVMLQIVNFLIQDV